jgi:hypothetical protein
VICQVRPGQASDHGHALRNLRHGAATLVLAAGPDLRIVQDQLGHSSIVLTTDTYISVLPQTARAQDTAGSSSPPASAPPTAPPPQEAPGGPPRSGPAMAIPGLAAGHTAPAGIPRRWARCCWPARKTADANRDHDRDSDDGLAISARTPGEHIRQGSLPVGPTAIRRRLAP